MVESWLIFTIFKQNTDDDDDDDDEDEDETKCLDDSDDQNYKKLDKNKVWLNLIKILHKINFLLLSCLKLLKSNKQKLKKYVRLLFLIKNAQI